MKNRNILNYFLVVFVLTIPSYVLIFIESQKVNFLPEKAFPFLILAAIVPTISAVILSKEKNKLLTSIFNIQIIKNKKWTLISVFLMPLIFSLSYGILFFTGQANNLLQGTIITYLISILIFFIMAITEELGWMGYIFDPIESKFGTFKATLLLSFIWSIWHLPFYIFMINSFIPIILLLLCLLGLRFIIVGLYKKANKSIYVAIILHTMYNISISIFPNFQSQLGLMITCILIFITALTVSLKK